LEEVPDAAGASGEAQSVSGSAEPRFTVAAVARRLGVAPATLRTWDRRYGLGPSVHAAGAHRRYSAADVARLEAMRRLIHRGVTPADAATVALGDRDPARPAAGGELGQPPAGPADGALSGSAAPAPPSAAGGAAVALPADPAEIELVPSAPGVPVLDVLPKPLDDLAAARGLLKAALSLDAPAVSASLHHSLQRVGTVATWERLLRPVLSAAGQRWASSGEGIEVEHLLSDVATVLLRERAAGVPETGGRPVLLACVPDEQHSLPLAALSAGLGERGVGTRVLGPSLPVTALASAIRRTGPAAVFLWAQLPANGDASLLEQLPVTRPPVAVIVGGPGWRPDRLPPRVSYAADLSAAIQLLHEAVALVIT